MANFLESAHIKIDRTDAGPVIWLSIAANSYSPGELRALGHHLALVAEAAVREHEPAAVL